MQRSKTRFLSVVGLILIGVVVGVIFSSNMNWTPNGFASKKTEDLTLGSQEALPESVIKLQDTGKAFTAVSKEIIPSVVSIATNRVVKGSSEANPFQPFFREFFGRDFQSPEPRAQRLQGLGSGVIVSEDGYILTNHHVISNADEITVILSDKQRYEAELIGTDPLTEVAVIKIDGKDLKAARLGNSDKMEIGEWVLAVGNPFSLRLSSTVTAGIVSAVGRSIGIINDKESDQSGGSYAIENFIQTDAAINPGNSGGALVNLKAEVIGINTAIATQSGGYQGYGFAVPINLAKKIMKDLISQGYVTRAWLGIGMQPVTEEVAERFKLDKPMGVRVAQVMDDSPADKAGLKLHDIIIALDGVEVNQSNEIQNAIALKSPGDEVVLTLIRDGKQKKITVKLGQRDTGKEEAGGDSTHESMAVGMDVQTLTEEWRSRLDLDDDDRGVMITSIEPLSPAEDAGLAKYDLITQIEEDEIENVSDYRKALKKYEPGDVVIFYIKRRGVEVQAFVKFDDDEQ